MEPDLGHGRRRGERDVEDASPVGGEGVDLALDDVGAEERAVEERQLHRRLLAGRVRRSILGRVARAAVPSRIAAGRVTREPDRGVGIVIAREPHHEPEQSCDQQEREDLAGPLVRSFLFTHDRGV